MSAVDEVMEKLKSMTLLEASELVKAIEETFDVDASAAAGGGVVMAAAAPGAAAAGDAGGDSEKSEFDLVLDEFPADKKIAVLKIVREITGLGLKEAKAAVEATPKAIKEGASKVRATHPHMPAPAQPSSHPRRVCAGRLRGGDEEARGGRRQVLDEVSGSARYAPTQRRLHRSTWTVLGCWRARRRSRAQLATV